MLTALCVALPARAGLIIIGGEGALVLGGLAAAVTPFVAQPSASRFDARLHGRRGNDRGRPVDRPEWLDAPAARGQ